MNVHDFTSLFEIFCAFNLAYVVIDQVSQSSNESSKPSYISIITDKILRIYVKIHEDFSEMNNSILGMETSMKILEIPQDNDRVRQDYDSKRSIIAKKKNDIKLSQKIVNDRIKTSFQTKAFAYNCSFLTLYCLSILVYSGITVGAVDYSKYDNSLLAMIILTFIFLWCGWAYDEEDEVKSRTNKFVCAIKRVNVKLNGYNMAFYIFILLVFCSIASYFIPTSYTKYYDIYHNGLVLFSILIPVANFIVYFVKASKRGESNKQQLEEQVSKIKQIFEYEISHVEHFIAHHTYKDNIEPENTEMY